MDIIKNRKKVFALSAIVIAIGLIVMIMNINSGKKAFNYDVQFQGGTAYTFDIGKDFENSDIEKIISDTTSQTGTVQRIGGDDSTEVQVKLLELTPEERIAFTDALYAFYGIDDTSLLNMTVISPTISKEMRNNAFLAVIVASIAMLIYVSFRFKDVQTGASAILALIHDIIIVTLFYSVFRIPLNYSFIAVVLTVLGYSINSTIVIFDRVRENKHLSKKHTNAEYINISVTQTIKRSIYTSITTLLPVIALYVFGVQSIKEFTLPIIVGVVVGTYSSVFLSGNIWYTLTSKKEKEVK